MANGSMQFTGLAKWPLLIPFWGSGETPSKNPTKEWNLNKSKISAFYIKKAIHSTCVSIKNSLWKRLVKTQNFLLPWEEAEKRYVFSATFGWHYPSDAIILKNKRGLAKGNDTSESLIVILGFWETNGFCGKSVVFNLG